MTKFNTTRTRPAVHSPVVTAPVATGHTHEGAPGYAREPRAEMFLLAVTNMVSEDTFYEQAATRDSRYQQLIHTVAAADPDWTAGFLRWLRGAANMRSASLVGALEAARAMLKAQVPGARGIINSVLQRADEPGEALSYWVQHYGRALPQPVKRGVADAAARLYNERTLLKYDTASHGFRFGDVLDLTHPTPRAPWQGHLFDHALARRHGRGNHIPIELPILTANALLRTMTASDPGALLHADLLAASGMTWEDALSLAGGRVDKGRLWEALIPNMGLMALARNLRNFDQEGVSDTVALQVAARFVDPEEITRSRMFPFRWLAAYRHAPSLRWGPSLDIALTLSLNNVPELTGRTLILVDLSGSMSDPAAGKLSDLSRADAAKVFGAALAKRAENPTLVWFHSYSRTVDVPRGGSLLKLVEAFPSPCGSTATQSAVVHHYASHDRVIIITDEQAHYGGGGDVTVTVPARVPVYTWNLGGYQHGHAPSGLGTRHTFGGLTDAGFQMIPLLEAGRDADWPWAQTVDTLPSDRDID